jgi:hypothetical protein
MTYLLWLLWRSRKLNGFSAEAACMSFRSFASSYTVLINITTEGSTRTHTIPSTGSRKSSTPRLPWKLNLFQNNLFCDRGRAVFAGTEKGTQWQQRVRTTLIIYGYLD